MGFLRFREGGIYPRLASFAGVIAMMLFFQSGPFHHLAMGFTLSYRGYQSSTSRQKFLVLRIGSQSLDAANSSEERNSTVVSSPTTTSSSTGTSQCPFVKFFPRYRIDLTSRKSRNKETTSWFSLPSLPLKGMSQSLEKARIERQVQPGGEFVWIPNVDGISALAQLWSHTDRLLQSTTESQASSVVLSLPDASPPLVQNWVEIVEWMMSRYPFADDTSIILEATLLKTPEKDDSTQRNTVQIRKRVGDDSSSRSTIGDFEVEAINRRTQAWVKRILVDTGICPFTKSVKKSGQGLADVGVPVGTIAYHASPAIHPVSLFADTFQAIEDMIQAGPSGKSGVSSILLAAPAFDDNFDLWSGPIFAMLEASVVAAMAEAQVGVVCFHPNYACPDGSSWPGFGHMHSVTRLEKWYRESLVVPSSASTAITTAPSEDEREASCPLSTEDIAAGGAWQRRTPHATINVLRADQLEAAEAKRSSGNLYPINIEKLVGSRGIGSDQLARDLERERQLP